MMYTLVLAVILAMTAVLGLPQAAAAEPAVELISAGRVDDAIRVLRGRIQQSPNDAEAYHLLARAYFSLQRWDSAIEEGQKAIALDPNNARYHLWLGRAYGEKADDASWVNAMGFAKKARAEFERAVQLNGSSVEARTDLAEFYAEAPGFLGGGKDKAAAQADAVRKLGDEATAHWIAGRIAESAKDYTAAEQHLKAAIAASNGNPGFILNLASFYRRRGRVEDVQRTVENAVQAATRAQNTHVLYDAAETLYRAGRNFSGAAQLLRTYIAAASHAEDAPVFRAHYLLGALLEKMGDKAAAADQYRAALTLASNFEPAVSALKRLR
ncbi:MAG: tetratricopeptide repeat protein [Terriglobales bacterium]